MEGSDAGVELAEAKSVGATVQVTITFKKKQNFMVEMVGRKNDSKFVSNMMLKEIYEGDLANSATKTRPCAQFWVRCVTTVEKIHGRATTL